jgi:DNA-binding PadR family transcriptional regulator
MAFIGRHRRGRGFGGLAGGFEGGRGFGRDGLPRGRRLGSEELQLVLLALLEEKPSHGYELIKLLAERSDGFYSPSPGMIYPALTYLEEIGYASVTAEGTKKLYGPTEAGLAHLATNREAAEAILTQMKAVGERMKDVRRAFAGETGSAEEDSFGSDDFRAARRELRRALHDLRHAAPDEIRRVAEILRRAAGEILRK